MSRVITGTFTEPDLATIAGTIKFVAEQSSAGIPITTEGDITVTAGAYSGTIAEGVYTVKFIYADPVSGVNRVAILGTGVAVVDGAAIDVITLCGLSDVPTPVTQLAIDAAITAHVAEADPHTQYLTSTEGDAAYAPLSHVGAGGNEHAGATTITGGFMTATQATKLDGIEAGAEANNISDVNATDLTDGTDTTLHYHAADRDRANHTGTQTLATISDAGGAASLNVGTTTGTVAAGDDARILSVADNELLNWMGI